jgi:hypothetical protein
MISQANILPATGPRKSNFRHDATPCVAIFQLASLG